MIKIIIVKHLINISLEQDIRIRNLEINPTIIFICFAIISTNKVLGWGSGPHNALHNYTLGH
jgi:hypothetical protein